MWNLLAWCSRFLLSISIAFYFDLETSEQRLVSRILTTSNMNGELNNIQVSLALVHQDVIHFTCILALVNISLICLTWFDCMHDFFRLHVFSWQPIRFLVALSIKLVKKHLHSFKFRIYILIGFWVKYILKLLLLLVSCNIGFCR